MIASYYGPIESSRADFFEWQYFANPSGPVLLWVAHAAETDAVVGQHVLLPMRFYVDQVETKSALSFNALVEPAYHGQGIWSVLGNKTHDQAKEMGTLMTYGIPNPNSHGPMVRMLAYERVFDVPVLVKPLDMGAAVRTVISGAWGQMAAGPAGWLRPLIFPTARKPRNAPEVTPVPRFDPAFDRLAVTAAGRYRLILVRDAAHLNWRYVDCPTRTTMRWMVRDGDRVVAYAILRLTDFRGLKLGVLLDFLTDGTPEGRLAGLALMAHAEESVRQEGCALLLGFCLAHTTEFSLLARSGWKVGPARLLPQPFPFLVKPMDWPASRPDIHVSANWFVTTGDYDVF